MGKKISIGELILQKSELDYKQRFQGADVEHEYTAVYHSHSRPEVLDLIPRTEENLPIAGFNVKSWVMFIVRRHEAIVGKPYPEFPRTYSLNCSIFLDYVMNEICEKNDLNAKELANFFISHLKYIKSIDTEFQIHDLKFDALRKKTREFIKKIKENREKNKTDKLCHFPYRILTGDKFDIIKIYEMFPDKKTGFMYAYGLPIFCKVHQLTNNWSFDESKDYTKKIFNDEIIKPFDDYPDAQKSVCQGIAKNSMYWGPYGKDIIFPPQLYDKNVFDWIGEYKKLWEYYTLRNEHWWIGTMKSFKMISAVYDLFNVESLKIK